jgi:hypothetical protein
MWGTHPGEAREAVTKLEIETVRLDVGVASQEPTSVVAANRVAALLALANVVHVLGRNAR